MMKLFACLMVSCSVANSNLPFGLEIKNENEYYVFGYEQNDPESINLFLIFQCLFNNNLAQEKNNKQSNVVPRLPDSLTKKSLLASDLSEEDSKRIDDIYAQYKFHENYRNEWLIIAIGDGKNLDESENLIKWMVNLQSEEFDGLMDWMIDLEIRNYPRFEVMRERLIDLSNIYEFGHVGCGFSKKYRFYSGIEKLYKKIREELDNKYEYVRHLYRSDIDPMKEYLSRSRVDFNSAQEYKQAFNLVFKLIKQLPDRILKKSSGPWDIENRVAAIYCFNGLIHENDKHFMPVKYEKDDIFRNYIYDNLHACNVRVIKRDDFNNDISTNIDKVYPTYYILI